MADEGSTKVRSIVEKVLEADVTDQIARRGRELAATVGEATEAVSLRASEAWRDSAPQRREMEKTARRTSREALRWSEKAWKRDVRPALRELWSKRGAAAGATAAAIPAGREIVEDAAARLGMRKRRERRHWMAFFLGLLIGAAAGAVVAMLTTPKPGREMRDELAVKARDAAERAREAASSGEWVPLFQREPTNGGAVEPATPIETTGETPASAPESTPEGGEHS